MKSLVKVVSSLMVLGGLIAMTNGANANLKGEAISLAKEQSDGDNEKICLIESATTASKSCEDGDIMLFIPKRITSTTTKESIILASLVCNFKFEVMHGPDALSCVFTTKRRTQWQRFGME